MIDQEKVRDMTRMAILESREGKRELRITSSKRIDYVVKELVVGFIVGTICFVGFFLFWFFLSWDTLNEVFADGNYMGFLMGTLHKYAIFVICYTVLCGIIAAVQYKRYYRRKKAYMEYVQRMMDRYAAEEEEEEE